MSIAHAFAVRIRMNYQFEALSSMLRHEIAMDITIDALKEEILFWLNTENLIFIEFISRVHHSEEMKRSLVQSVMADVDLGMDNDMIQKNRPYCLGAEQWDTTICAGLFIV